MFVPTPWNATSVVVLLWQLSHVVETNACVAAFSTGELVVLKPPVAKFCAWQDEQSVPPLNTMWVDRLVTRLVTPYQASPNAWHEAHPLLMLAWFIPVPVNVAVLVWQVLHWS